jgi:hypothetical protein
MHIDRTQQEQEQLTTTVDTQEALMIAFQQAHGLQSFEFHHSMALDAASWFLL